MSTQLTKELFLSGAKFKWHLGNLSGIYMYQCDNIRAYNGALIKYLDSKLYVDGCVINSTIDETGFTLFGTIAGHYVEVRCKYSDYLLYAEEKEVQNV